MRKNIILNSDSYKYSMFNQYPEGTETVYSYIESRGGAWPSTVFFGLQAFIIEYLLKPITKEDIDIAEQVITAHGEPFYRQGWEYILAKHGGKLPVIIRAVPEGTVVPVKNVLATIENTDPECYWLTTFLETALLRAVWYPTSVATNSYESKKIILKWLKKNGDITTIDYKLHDFGARGVSSLESSGIGGSAHLVNFSGTDNISGILHSKLYYNSGIVGHSVPAMEHSTVTSWGRENEVESYRNMIRQYPNGIVSVVSDSYNIYNACKMFGSVLKQDLIENNTQLVVRPDSGNPNVVISECLLLLDEYFGHTVNSKGYKVLNNVKILQGDGITGRMIDAILDTVDCHKYSSDNLLFGQGGALLQGLDRDTQKFAMKCSAIKVNGKWRDVFKDPVTDPGKSSKKGRVTLYKDSDGKYYSDRDGSPDQLITVFENGYLISDQKFEDIRQRAQITA